MIKSKANWLIRYLKLPGKWGAGFKKLFSSLMMNDIDIMQMNFNKKEIPTELTLTNNFYLKCILSYFDAKSRPLLQNLEQREIRRLPLFGNYLFKVNTKCIFFKEWIESNVLYIKDLVNNDGTLKSENEIVLMIHNKRDIIRQIYIIRMCIYKLIQQVVFDEAFEENDKNTLHMNNGSINITKINNKILYLCLCKNKNRNLMENCYSIEFEIENSTEIWSKIYEKKLRDINIVKLREFNFKILHNIVPCGYILSKWNNVSEKCEKCNMTETTKHMLYECARVKTIWTQISRVLNYDIKWKTLVSGPVDEFLDNDSEQFINIVSVIVIYTIFKQNSHCKFKKLNYANVNLYTALKTNILFYGKLWIALKHVNESIFDDIINCL